ncbi:hypothetical protein WG66_004308 [Moniliophthora roreri]|nr:hypothetical protein WG66_004308 [Moniliophthora roreri]
MVKEQFDWLHSEHVACSKVHGPFWPLTPTTTTYRCQYILFPRPENSPYRKKQDKGLGKSCVVL